MSGWLPGTRFQFPLGPIPFLQRMFENSPEAERPGHFPTVLCVLAFLFRGQWGQGWQAILSAAPIFPGR